LAALSIPARTARSISLIERIEFWRNRVFDFFRIRVLRKSIFGKSIFAFDRKPLAQPAHYKMALWSHEKGARQFLALLSHVFSFAHYCFCAPK
jgi:hypothetical protein